MHYKIHLVNSNVTHPFVHASCAVAMFLVHKFQPKTAAEIIASCECSHKLLLAIQSNWQEIYVLMLYRHTIAHFCLR